LAFLPENCRHCFTKRNARANPERLSNRCSFAPKPDYAIAPAGPFPGSQDCCRYENVIADTDCGLAGRLYPQLVWAKLEAFVAGAKLATSELWP
jgi:hypothetical protein